MLVVSSSFLLPPSCFLLLVFNHDHPRPVFTAGPQPRPSTSSVPCRTSIHDHRRSVRGPAGGVQLSGLQRPKPLVVSDDASRTGGVIDQMSRNLHAIVMQFYARSCVGHVVWTTLQPIRLRESESGRSSGSCRAHLPSRVRLKKKKHQKTCKQAGHEEERRA